MMIEILRARLRSLAAAAVLTAAALAAAPPFPASAQIAAGGYVSMTLSGGVDRPLDTIRMPLVNGGDPSVKVGLAQISVADGVMRGRLTTRLGFLTFESAAPSGPGAMPAVTSAEFFDSAGAQYRMGAGGAELVVEDYIPGAAITLRFASGMEGVDGGPPAAVAVTASAPVAGR